MAEKKQRKVALTNFTRNLNSLVRLLDNSSPKVLVTPQFEKLRSHWTKLEESQDLFLATTDIDIETDVNGITYIDGPDQLFQEIMIRYSSYLKASDDVERATDEEKAVEDRAKETEVRKEMAKEKKAADDIVRREELQIKLNSEKAELQSAIATFKRLSLNWKDTVNEAPDADKRVEWQKVEAEFHSLKNQLIKVVGIDHSQDVTDINELFVNDAENIYKVMQTWIMSQLKPVVMKGAYWDRKGPIQKRYH